MRCFAYLIILSKELECGSRIPNGDILLDVFSVDIAHSTSTITTPIILLLFASGSEHCPPIRDVWKTIMMPSTARFENWMMSRKIRGQSSDLERYLVAWLVVGTPPSDDILPTVVEREIFKIDPMVGRKDLRSRMTGGRRWILFCGKRLPRALFCVFLQGGFGSECC
jgi:hypothetical protein